MYGVWGWVWVCGSGMRVGVHTYDTQHMCVYMYINVYMCICVHYAIIDMMCCGVTYHPHVSRVFIHVSAHACTRPHTYTCSYTQMVVIPLTNRPQSPHHGGIAPKRNAATMMEPSIQARMQQQPQPHLQLQQAHLHPSVIPPPHHPNARDRSHRHLVQRQRQAQPQAQRRKRMMAKGR